jgi:hypothetical protein
MAAACPGDRRGVRDRALLLLLAASGLRHATLRGVDAEHLQFTATAVELTLDHASVDGAGEDRRSVPHHPNPRLCPVQALRGCLATFDTPFGPVFRKIDSAGALAVVALPRAGSARGRAAPFLGYFGPKLRVGGSNHRIIVR